MRVKTTPDPLHLGGLPRLAALVVMLSLGGCFVDETPESSDGEGSSITDPSTTLSTSPATSTTDPGTDASSNGGSDSEGTTATSEVTSTTSATATATTNTSATTNTTATSTTTNTTNTTATSGDSDATSDPTGTSTGGVDPCDGATLKLAMTAECIPGTALASANYGHELCASEFGESWRWLEFHDGEAIGWTAYGTWQSPAGAGERGWVWIDDNTGQCWSSTHGMTWHRAEADSCKASCAPADGLEGPGFDPLPGKCNPYDGDTPCELCRRLICFSG